METLTELPRPVSGRTAAELKALKRVALSNNVAILRAASQPVPSPEAIAADPAKVFLHRAARLDLSPCVGIADDSVAYFRQFVAGRHPDPATEHNFIGGDSPLFPLTKPSENL